MSDPIRDFLAVWKPFASLPPQNGLRAEFLRFLDAKSSAEREAVLARVNPLFRLQCLYAELGILREGETAKAALFRDLLAWDSAAFAEALRRNAHKTFLTKLLEGFEFDRAAVPPNHRAVRRFLEHFWALRPGDPPIKYGFYPNGVLYSAGGKTHDELTREFTQEGLGSGMPVAGGFMARRAPLAFAYDTHSQFVRSGDQRQAVGEALRRWIRLTGADDARVRIDYAERLG